jgi:branched-chain amino acid transport system substrate-binding protein
MIAGLGLVGHTAQATISDNVIRIGFVTDMASVFADIDGAGGVEAVRMAIADAGGQIDGKKIELLFADHQNKADVAAARAREWFDQQKIGMLIGGTNSGVNLALAGIAAEKKKPFLAIGAASSDLTGAQCTPYTVHWAYDTVALARGTGSAVVKAGGKTWYFLTADYAFGHALERDTAKVVREAGGEVRGQVRAPLNSSDFSSFLLQAQSG